MSPRRARRIRAGLIAYARDMRFGALGASTHMLPRLARDAYWEAAARSHRHDEAIARAMLRRALSGGNA